MHNYKFCFFFFFFFKQKTAYEITYGDWSSDVCSSDLPHWGSRLLWQKGLPLLTTTGHSPPVERCHGHQWYQPDFQYRRVRLLWPFREIRERLLAPRLHSQRPLATC